MRLFASLILGKSIGKITRTLNLGAGASAPGHFGLKFNPDIVETLVKSIPENIIITGTNGKTTTSKLLSEFALASGKTIIRNKTGSNLERGIASELISKTSILGKIKNIDLGIWEVDEAAFNHLAKKISPGIIIFNNLFRDQLDRYGEVDSVLRKWKDTLKMLNPDTKIILNSDDENILSLKSALKNSTTFGVKNFKFESESLIKAQETQKPDVEATVKTGKGLDSISFVVDFQKKSEPVTLPIPGVYNIYNFLSAFTSGLALNFEPDKMISSLKNFTPAFGRMEKLSYQGKQIWILLIKNPYGANQVLGTLAGKTKKGDSFLVALNDNFADGKDVSWIWDAKWESLQAFGSEAQARRGAGDWVQIVCSGTRAEDLALRLKYAGIETKEIQLQPEIEKAFEAALKNTENRLFILPTYTALLQLQKILTKKGIKTNYWEGL